MTRKTKLIILTVLLVSFISNSQNIYKSSIDAGGASASVGDIQVFYTIGEVNVQELNSGNIQASEGFVGPAFKIKIDPKLYLQGAMQNPLVAGQMNDHLRSNGFVPTVSPYSDGKTCDASVFNITGANAIVDWVWVELRAANDNTKLINGRSALLQRDGDVVDLDGVSNLIMTAAPTNYFVVMDHRNHLGAMSANSIGLSEAIATLVDFGNIGFQTFGSNAQVTLGSGNTALWAGDVNNNGQIRYLGPGNDTNTIKDTVLGDSGNTTSSNFYPFSGYNNADINMNGQIRYLGPGNDTNVLKDIILSHPSNGTFSNFFPFVSQIPN
ncbi:hemagglutinin protein [Flavobacteriales bacterium 34_180_T64]|nr:hemagglutinin protein [Flavobacteriales bacterium 34_180_T64]